MNNIFNSKELGKKIAALRTDKGMSQYELGKLVNISQSAISSLELGKTESFNLEKLYRITEALNTNLDFVLHESLSKSSSVELGNYQAERLFADIKKLSEDNLNLLHKIADYFIEFKNAENR